MSIIGNNCTCDICGLEPIGYIDTFLCKEGLGGDWRIREYYVTSTEVVVSLLLQGLEK